MAQKKKNRVAPAPSAVRSRKKEQALIPVTFTPVTEVFEPMVEVLALKDISGWASTEKRVKWSMSANQKYIISEQKAREFVAKGYAEYTGPQKTPITQAEIDEQLSQVTTIKMGGD